MFYYTLNSRQCWKGVIILSAGAFVLWNYWLLSRNEDVPDDDETSRSEINRLNIPRNKHDGDNHNQVSPGVVTQLTNHNVQRQLEKANTLVTTIKPNIEMNNSYPRYEDKQRGIIVYGRIQSKFKYAVFSSTMHNKESLNYMFDLPLTTLAWERIGFKSLVILVADNMDVMTNKKVLYIMSTLFQLQAVVVVMQSHKNFAVMISQVSRLFVPYLVDSRCIDDMTSWEDTYVVTSDADLWPLDKNIYIFPDNNTDVLCLNAHCCGDFLHHERSYSMIPIGNIGMRIRTWRSVTRRRGFVPLGVDGMITYFSREFGTVATSAIEKGENLGWFMDQQMISILISDWSRRENRASRVNYVRRDVGRDRIDRSAWRPYTIDGAVDAHILESGYQPITWHRLEALLVLMYDTPLFTWCTQYARTFMALS